jgi:hypothetical protein
MLDLFLEREIIYSANSKHFNIYATPIFKLLKQCMVSSQT